jgi:hypothetical protein
VSTRRSSMLRQSLHSNNYFFVASRCKFLSFCCDFPISRTSRRDAPQSSPVVSFYYFFFPFSFFLFFGIFFFQSPAPRLLWRVLLRQYRCYCLHLVAFWSGRVDAMWNLVLQSG